MEGKILQKILAVEVKIPRKEIENIDPEVRVSDHLSTYDILW